jgi:type I restriction enzyme S subunit
MKGDWISMTLAEACVYLSRGVTPSYTEDGGIRVLNQKCVRDQAVTFAPARRTDTLRKSIPQEKLLQPNDILVNSTGEGTLGRVAQIKSITEPTTVDSHVTILRPNPKLIDPSFLGCLVRKLQPEIEQMAEGSTGQTELSRTRLGELEIDVPPLAEQKAIAKILGDLDDKIELNRRMNETLEAMARALFQSWFVDFDPVRAKLDGRQPTGMDKATAALFPEHLQDSQLGQIPAGWKVGRIQECCIKIQNGGTPRRNEPRYWDGGDIPWLTSGEVRQPIIRSAASFITEEGLASSSAKWVPAFSTVVALYGATAGQVSLASSQLTTNQAVCALIPYRDFALFNYLAMRGASKELESKAVGSAQQNISKGVVEEVKVVLPPSALVERFAALVSPLFDRWISNLNQSVSLATLRDALQPKLLCGKLSIVNQFIE